MKDLWNLQWVLPVDPLVTWNLTMHSWAAKGFTGVWLEGLWWERKKGQKKKRSILISPLKSILAKLTFRSDLKNNLSYIRNRLLLHTRSFSSRVDLTCLLQKQLGPAIFSSQGIPDSEWAPLRRHQPRSQIARHCVINACFLSLHV